MKLHFTSQLWMIFVVVAFYWVVSITTVFVNKILLSSNLVQFDAPLFITWFQCLISVMYYGAYHFIQREKPPSSPFDMKIIKAVFPLSIVFASMIIFNNLCLKHVDVSFYYIGRSLTTVFNVILTYVVLREKTSMQTCFCCLIIVFGFWLGVDQEHFIGTFSLEGTIYGILGSLSVAYYAIKVKEVLPRIDSTIWLLSYYNNIYSCILFFPLIIFCNEIEVIYNYKQITSFYFWTLMFTSGLCGLSIGYATTLQIKVTSPLTHNISGTAKACFQTILASNYYVERKPWLWWLSNYIVLMGSACYTRVKQKELERRNTLLLK